MPSLIRPGRWLNPALALLALALYVSRPAPRAAAAAFGGQANHCGIILDAPVRDFVIGTVDGIATPAQSAALLSCARAAGLWRRFPPPAAVFAQKIQPISINFAPGRSITVLAGADEARLLRLRNGDLIRYAPHRGLHEKPRPGDPYWAGIGCVAPLCRRGDTLCASGFQPGLYRLSDGAALDASGLHPLAGGGRINTMSMRPETK